MKFNIKDRAYLFQDIGNTTGQWINSKTGQTKERISELVDHHSTFLVRHLSQSIPTTYLLV